MKWMLKILSVLLMWGVVGYMVVYVDPATVRDIGYEGAYLPFVAIVGLALGYTIVTITHKWLFASIVSVLAALALMLSIMQLLTWFTGLVIVLLIIFSGYMLRVHDLVSESGKTIE